MSGLETIVESTSPETTMEIGREIGRSAGPGSLVVLEGDLGTGKTVLAHGIAEGLGIDEWRGSPTFNLIHEYHGRLALYHVDAYRLHSDELLDLDLEMVMAGRGVVVVEWGKEVLQDFLTFGPSKLTLIHLRDAGQDARQIEIV